jgi:hypothetical protein
MNGLDNGSRTESMVGIDPKCGYRCAVLDLQSAPLTDLPALHDRALTADVVRAQHRIADLDVLSDANIEQILDRHPRNKLMAFTMGSDPEHPEEWTLVDARDASGAELVQAAQRGRLWFNVLSVDANHPELGQLRDTIAEELAAALPDLVPGSVRLTLLVSSRDAMVYYHADAGPNLLLHVRGQKRLFVYPPLEPHFADPQLMEDIFAGVRIENLPYRSEFEASARDYLIDPGQLIAWPQNSPHRVVNVDSANVSLAVEFVTRRSHRRVLTWSANRFLSRTLHLPCRSTRETGPWPWLKRFGYRVARKLHIDRTIPKHVFVTDLVIDAGSATGTRRLAEPISLSF